MALPQRRRHFLIQLIADSIAALKRDMIDAVGALSDPGHTHAFTGTAQVQRRTTLYVRPDAAGTAHSTATSKADAQPKTPSAQPDFPRTLRITTAGGWASPATVSVTVTGQVRGVGGITEVITVPAAGITTNGATPFERITSMTWEIPAGWTAGTFALEGGPALGLPLPPGFAALGAHKEMSYDDGGAPPNPSDQTVGAVDVANGTYTPTTALNGANAVQVWFGFTATSAGTNASASTGVTVADAAVVHLDRDERAVAAPNATDLATSLALCRACHVAYERHRADALQHKAADATNTVAATLASIVDLAGAITAANQLKTAHNAHRAQAGVHVNNDGGNAVTAVNATDQGTLNTLLNDIKTQLNAHFSLGFSAASWRVQDA